jgi:hypothetical protein
MIISLKKIGLAQKLLAKRFAIEGRILTQTDIAYHASRLFAALNVFALLKSLKIAQNEPIIYSLLIKSEPFNSKY